MVANYTCKIILLIVYTRIVSPISEDGSLMLGCIICKQFFYYIDTFYQLGMDKESIKESIHADYCNDIGLFSSICVKTLNAYYEDMWINSLNMLNKTVENRCQNVGLCPTVDQLDVCSSTTDSKYSIHRNKFIKVR
uniref:Saposin B-type domain-containing protein n=1 Tax=Strongyloides papillosus TaxID=174720 RepID=A0A0N5BTV4_STREA